MLLRDNASGDELVECQQMIRHFARKCKNFYGAGFMSYNVHSLLHLTLDYKMYSSLDKINSFSFESLVLLKAHVKSGYKPLQQIGCYVHYSDKHIVRKRTTL